MQMHGTSEAELHSVSLQFFAGTPQKVTTTLKRVGTNLPSHLSILRPQNSPKVSVEVPIRCHSRRGVLWGVFCRYCFLST